jgi:hypothetical protein
VELKIPRRDFLVSIVINGMRLNFNTSLSKALFVLFEGCNEPKEKKMGSWYKQQVHLHFFFSFFSKSIDEIQKPAIASVSCDGPFSQCHHCSSSLSCVSRDPVSSFFSASSPPSQCISCVS